MFATACKLLANSSQDCLLWVASPAAAVWSPVVGVLQSLCVEASPLVSCQEKWIFPVTSQEMEIGMFERRFIDSSKNWMIQRRDFVQARRPAHDYPSKRATQISLSNLMNSYLQCHAVRRYWLGFKIRLEFGSYFSLKWWPNVRLWVWDERERGSCHFTWTECMVEKSRTSDDFWSVKVHSAAF